jgi:hypothetical protein
MPYAAERFESDSVNRSDHCPYSDLTNEQLRQAITRIIQNMSGRHPEDIEQEMQELLDELCTRLSDNDSHNH